MSEIQPVLLGTGGVDTRRLTGSEAGLAKTPPGAARLLGELVRRGLDRDHLHAAAAIALELDHPRKDGR